MTPRLRRRGDPQLLLLLRAAGANVEQSSRLLRDLIASYPEHDHLVEEIVACEHVGDSLTHDLLHRLNDVPPGRRPFDVAEGHGLATAVDDIVDHAEETADFLRRYGVEAPMAQAEELANVLLRAGEQVSQALQRLAEGASYGDRLIEIHRLENEGDAIVREAVAALFVGGIDPIVVIRWKDIFESLEQAIDACEHVGHRLEGIAIRRGRRR